MSDVVPEPPIEVTFPPVSSKASASPKVPVSPKATRLQQLRNVADSSPNLLGLLYYWSCCYRRTFGAH